MKDTLNVIQYLLDEIKCEETKILEYKQKQKNAKEFCENHNQKMDYKVMENFDLFNVPRKSNVKQNIVKIRKLLLKMRGEI